MKYIFFLFLFFLILPISGGVVFAQTTDLNQALQEKTKRLQEIQKQLQESQQNLSQTEGQSRTLKEELTKISRDIKQTNLGIQSSAVTIEKLGLEIGSLQSQMTKIDTGIADKKNKIISLIRALQEKDNETLVMRLLRNKALSASLADTQGLSAINGQLTAAIQDLKFLHSQLDTKLGQTTDKKEQVQSEHKSLKVKQTIVLDKERERKDLLTQTKNQEKVYQKQISELEKQQLAIADEIEGLEKQLRAQSDPNSLPAARQGLFSWPAIGRLAQQWGATSFALNGGYRGHWHNGVDISAPVGTIITAPANGTVVAMGNQDQYCYHGAYGKYIVIKHDIGLVTLYGHLSAFNVAVGQTVARGAVIGYMGRTGYATGPHLHFTVWDGATFAVRPSRTCGPMPSGGDLNPMAYL